MTPEEIAKRLEDEAAQLVRMAKMLNLPWTPERQAKHSGYLECISLVKAMGRES